MPLNSHSVRKFITYVRSLRGDEIGEAQVFCDRLFQAFGHEGYKEAGAELAHRIKRKGHHTKFADLVWKPRLLLEMKKRGEKLEKHYQQIFDYWTTLVPNRPRYVVLCNFEEFWVYDFDQQIDEPMDKIQISDLENRKSAFNFLLPEPTSPVFRNNRIEVTKEAAQKVATIFNMLINRKEERDRAQRFILQCVVAMFSEDIGLLPENLFLSLLEECRKNGNSYDLIGGLFIQMNSSIPARGGRYANVQYFNGGVFSKIEPIELDRDEIDHLYEAAFEDWSKVNPAIFGTIFQNSMEQKYRHSAGAYYTSESDIQKVVFPTIVKPWNEKIEAAKSLKDLLILRKQLHEFCVLDPACGSGNFLYVGFRELRRIELRLLTKIYEDFGNKPLEKTGATVSIKQFFGIEKNQFGSELAKVTLMIAKQLAIKESYEWLKNMSQTLHFDFDYALPLDNLDNNILCEDALFANWPFATAIIGNPPFQSKNKMQKEFGPAYVRKMRDEFPDVPGRADYCVYWFRKAHDCIPEEGRVGFVGTNTIRQNYSREGSLDYIVSHGGTITEAVADQSWSGDAAVRVSIVNWVKGKALGKKRLFWQKDDGDWEQEEVDVINSSLSLGFDVTSAKVLQSNAHSFMCYQGQTPGHKGFLISPDEANQMIHKNKRNAEVLFPYLTGDELLSLNPPHPKRYVIDFQTLDLVSASYFKEPFQHLKDVVLPGREKAASEEIERNNEILSKTPHSKVNRHHQNFLNHWWHLSFCRPELLEKLSSLKRYIVCSRVTKQVIFEFIDTKIRPSDALQVFALQDDYSFGILQSSFHSQWFVAKGSSLGQTPRYTSNTVFDTFPWPQNPKIISIKKIALAATHLRALRHEMMKETRSDLRGLYNLLEIPGKNPLRDAHEALDNVVREAYNAGKNCNVLQFLLELNSDLVNHELTGHDIRGPGLPEYAISSKELTTEDCVKAKSFDL